MDAILPQFSVKMVFDIDNQVGYNCTNCAYF